MKISNETIKVLTNFVDINGGTMRFSEGNVLRTVSSGNSTFAEAVVNEHFPKEFIVYDLKSFLSIHSLFNDPDVVIDDKFLTVKGQNNQSVKYLFADDSMAKKCGKIKELEHFVSFKLSEEEINNLLNVANYLRIEYVIISSDGNGAPIKVSCENIKNPGDNFEIVIENSSSQKKFKSIHNTKDFTLMRGNYTVECSSRYTKFSHDNGKLNYWIGLNEMSEV